MLESQNEDTRSEHQSDDSFERNRIWPPQPKKRQKRAYLDFAKVAKTFPDVETEVICQLAEMKVIKPSNVLKLVPEATTNQISSFLQIAEKGYDNKKEVTPELAGGMSQLD